MPRRGRCRVLAAALPLVLLAVAPRAAWTDASWRDDEYSRPTVRAGVAPPTAPVCSGTGVVGKPTVSWTPPSPAPSGGYSWTLTVLSGLGSPGSGTLAGSATSWTDPGNQLSVLGSWRLSVIARSAATGWTSAPMTATVGRTLGLLASCSIP